MTEPEDPTQQHSEPMTSESSETVSEPPARMPGSFTPPPAPPPPALEPPAAIVPASMSGPASTDTQTWEVPPAAALAGAAAASQWAQPAAVAPQPVAPPPAPTPIAPPPPPQQWQQPQQTQPAPAQQWQQPQQAQPVVQPYVAPPPPPQQNWQQPQQQAQQQWPQQPQPPYQQPYGQPNPYAQPYAQPYPATLAGFRTSPLAVFAGLLLLVFGIGVIAIGVFAITQGEDLARFIRDHDVAIFGSQITRDTLRTVLSPSPGVLIVLGVLQILSGIGVMAHKSWARWLGFLLALLGLLVTVYAVSIGLAVAAGFTLAVIIGVVLLVGYVLIVVALLGGGSHFHRRVA